MKKSLVMSLMLVMMNLTASALGRGWEIGHLIVTFTDKETGGPITNATVTVETLVHLGFGAGGSPGDYERTSAMTDSNGVADVQFRFKVSHFDWWVSAPSHYRREFGIKKEFFRANVVPSDYENIDPFAPDHAAKEQEMKTIIESGDWQALQEKLEPKSVTYEDKVIRRSVSFYPKHNPQPMYSYGDGNAISLPTNEFTEVTNGIAITRFPSVPIDLKKARRVCLQGRDRCDAGEVEDVRIESYCIETNGVEEFGGCMVFPHGGGCYKGLISDDPSFPTVYEADTNAVYLSRIPFKTLRNAATGKVISAERILKNNEYLVIRTRPVTNECGDVVSWNYAKMMGPVKLSRYFSFGQIIFNPRPNDPNLEYDFHNLAGSRGTNRWP